MRACLNPFRDDSPATASLSVTLADMFGRWRRNRRSEQQALAQPRVGKGSAKDGRHTHKQAAEMPERPLPPSRSPHDAQASAEPAPTPPKDIKAGRLVKLLEADGFTLKRRTARSPSSGYVVALEGHVMIWSGEQGELDAWLDGLPSEVVVDHHEIYHRVDEMFITGHKRPDDGAYVLRPAAQMYDREEAIRLGRACGQETVVGLTTGERINLADCAETVPVMHRDAVAVETAMREQAEEDAHTFVWDRDPDDYPSTKEEFVEVFVDSYRDGYLAYDHAGRPAVHPSKSEDELAAEYQRIFNSEVKTQRQHKRTYTAITKMSKQLGLRFEYRPSTAKMLQEIEATLTRQGFKPLPGKNTSQDRHDHAQRWLAENRHR